MEPGGGAAGRARWNRGRHHDATGKDRQVSTDYVPSREDRFSFGIWTVGWQGVDVFGSAVRPPMPAERAVYKLAELGAYGVNFHDNDVFAFDATPAGGDERIGASRKALAETGLVVTTATTNLFGHPIFRDGAFTANDRQIRRFALAKVMRTLDLAADLGAKTCTFGGGRGGAESGAAKDIRDALDRYAEGLNLLGAYVRDQGYDIRFAIEPKPNEPRGDILLPTVGHALAFINSLEHGDMVGVNPEVGHEEMAGLNYAHGIAQALWHGKLFHIDLNGQHGPRYDQDLRFGAGNVRGAFWVVDTLEAGGYDGPVHFDYKPPRTEDDDGVWASAAACMRNYLILRAKVRAFRADPEVTAALRASGVDQLSSATLDPGATWPDVREPHPDTAALAQRYARLDHQVVQAHVVELVGLLEAVDEGPPLDGDAAPDRVHAPVRVGPAGGHVQVQGDHVALTPGAAQDVIAGRDPGPFGIIANRHPGAAAPGRHPQRQPARARRRGEHPQVNGAGPGVVGGDLEVQARPGQPGSGVLVDVQRVTITRCGGEVVLQGRDEAHDVRRAAGAVEPHAAPAGVVLLEVVLAALQRVDVEEPLAPGGDRGPEAVVEHAFHVVRVLRVAGGEQQPPAPLEAGDGGAGLVVGAVWGQLVPVAEALVRGPRPVAAGQDRLGRHHVVPAAQRGLQQFAVAGLGGHVGHSGLQVQRPHHVPDLGVGGAHRQVVLQVAAAHAGIPGQPPAALVDELAGQGPGGFGPRLPGEVRPRRLPDPGAGQGP